MQPVLAHYCENCQYNTPVPFTAAVFSENHHCAHCGSVSYGLRLRDDAENKNQAVDKMQQEELANLFNQLNFSNPTPPPDAPQQQHSQQQQQVVVEKIHDPQPITYASQHYTPTHHIVPVRFQTPPEPLFSPSQQQTQEEQHVAAQQQQRPTDQELVQMLVRNWIDPATLFPSQVELFRNADPDQRLRLLELWRISPPNNEAYDFPSEQMETSLQKEEALARMRYERNMGSGLGGNMLADAAPPRPSTAPPGTRASTSTAEPYMMSGYEMLARREYEMQAQQQEQAQGAQPLQETTRYNQATDPVFKGSSPSSVVTGLWSKPSNVQDMENAYGNFEAMREMENGGALARNGLDDEMIM